MQVVTKNQLGSFTEKILTETKELRIVFQKLMMIQN